MLSLAVVEIPQGRPGELLAQSRTTAAKLTTATRKTLYRLRSVSHVAVIGVPGSVKDSKAVNNILSREALLDHDQWVPAGNWGIKGTVTAATDVAYAAHVEAAMH